MSINISYLACFHIVGYSDSQIIIYQSHGNLMKLWQKTYKKTHKKHN